MQNKTLYPLFFLLQAVISTCNSQPMINLGEAVNSEYDEINPIISADGKYLYFVRKNHPENTYGTEDSEDIWYSIALSPNKWSKAMRLPSLNAARYNSVIAISKDDKRLLINGVFSANGKEFLRRGLSVVNREGDGTAGRPKALAISGLANMNRGMNTTGTWNNTESHIILSFTNKYMGDKYDLYVTSKKADGRWERPVKIEALCSHGSEEAPCLSDDEKTIYFSSDREGKYEIYESTRLDNSWHNWSKPARAKFAFNTAGYDTHLEFDEKHEYAYLTSTHESIGGFDIFYLNLKAESGEK